MRSPLSTDALRAEQTPFRGAAVETGLGSGPSLAALAASYRLDPGSRHADDPAVCPTLIGAAAARSR